MTAPYSSEFHRGSPARVYWLAFGGHGNGLDAEGWAPIIDVDERLAWHLLDALAAAGVAAYAAPMSVRASLLRSADRTDRIWVDAVAHSRAEDIIRIELPKFAAMIRPGMRER